MNHLPIALDSFEQYMSQINHFEPLDRATEEKLAWQYKENNDLDAAHQLTCANLRFVVKVAYEYRAYGLKLIDLIQEGNIGLMMAIKKFDPARNIRLISYAVWWIRAYMHNYIMSSWSLVKIGTTQAQKKLFFKLRQTRDAIKQLAGSDQYSDDTSEIAKQLNVSCRAVEEMSLRMSGRDSSLDMTLAPDSDTSHIENLADQRCDQEQSLITFESNQLRSQSIHLALSALNEREQYIITKRLLDEDSMTLQQLADYYGISKERVRQLEKRALEKLKDQLIETCHLEENNLESSSGLF
ncbi:MAG: RNA polymerase subunit sigma-70 [Desulfuromonadales bacterium C00003068]|jgi:RNA polymerase sigma-32 factor|nr:MAG: RNA polymerase subunit sigma-70 [Desulfuromonadales bacterium C00003068]